MRSGLSWVVICSVFITTRIGQFYNFLHRIDRPLFTTTGWGGGKGAERAPRSLLFCPLGRACRRPLGRVGRWDECIDDRCFLFWYSFFYLFLFFSVFIIFLCHFMLFTIDNLYFFFLCFFFVRSIHISVTPTAQLLRIGSQMQEVWGSSATGRVAGKSIPSLWSGSREAMMRIKITPPPPPPPHPRPPVRKIFGGFKNPF